MKLFSHLTVLLALVAADVHTQNKPGAPRMRLAFVDAEIKSVIGAIAKLSGANIIVAPGVTGKTTVKLADVTWRAALDLVVAQAGFEVVDEGATLRVVTPAMLDEKVTRTFPLKHTKPNGSQLAAIKRLLTDGGRVTYEPARNAVVVDDSWRAAIAVRRKVKEIDIDIKAEIAALTDQCEALAAAFADADPTDVPKLDALLEAVGELHMRLFLARAKAKRLSAEARDASEAKAAPPSEGSAGRE